MTDWHNPMVPGFNPDPSVVRVDGTYFLVTSSFEYLPGLPVYRSADLVDWVQVGNVAVREAQVGVGDVPAGHGVWAPTIRHRDGTFFVIVTVMGGRGCVLFTADDPAGPWSEGLVLDVDGIDPDLAWDESGAAFVTYAGASGIEQVRVDLARGTALEAPRRLWSGTGLQYPEAPHLYRRDGCWYLLIAEGGTERGHAVSVARGRSVEGPFEGDPTNPVLSARSTNRPVQSTGHADLVTAPDGTDVLVLLGVRPIGPYPAYSPLGRETFVTPVEWVDGWPRPAAVALAPRPGMDEQRWDFADPATLADPGWMAVRRSPDEVASVTATPGRLTLTGVPGGLDRPRPAFLGRRARHLTSRASTVVDASSGVGGLALRFDDRSHLTIQADGRDAGPTRVTAVAALPGLRQQWTADLPAGDLELSIDTVPPSGEWPTRADTIRLCAAHGSDALVLAELDGRYWSAETATYFTGRVMGLIATGGVVRFREFRYRGSESG